MLPNPFWDIPTLPEASLQLQMIHEALWPFLIITVASWRFLTIPDFFSTLSYASRPFFPLPDTSWGFLTIHDTSWLFLSLFDSAWGSLRLPDTSWCFLTLPHASLRLLVTLPTTWSLGGLVDCKILCMNGQRLGHRQQSWHGHRTRAPPSICHLGHLGTVLSKNAHRQKIIYTI